MSLRKLQELNKILIKFRVSRYKLFKVDTSLNIFSSLTYLIANLLFWYLITDSGFFIEGWSYQNILVFIAFSELFFGIDNSIFSMASRFWKMVHMGMLDTLLTRPLDPRVRIIILNIDYIGIISSFVSFATILYISNAKIDILNIIGGILILFTADIVLALIRLTMSYAAFWFGKMDAISEIADSLTWFNKYPLVTIPKAVRLLFKTLLPFYFFSTFSAEFIIGKLDNVTLTFGLLGLLVNLILWSLINHIIWKKGISRYESLNG